MLPFLTLQSPWGYLSTITVCCRGALSVVAFSCWGWLHKLILGTESDGNGNQEAARAGGFQGARAPVAARAPHDSVRAGSGSQSLSQSASQDLAARGTRDRFSSRNLPGSWNGPRPGWESSVWMTQWPGRAGLWVAGDQPSWDVTLPGAATPGSCNTVQGCGQDGRRIGMWAEKSENYQCLRAMMEGKHIFYVIWWNNGKQTHSNTEIPPKKAVVEDGIDAVM